MKAIVLHEYGGPEKLKYEDFEDPKIGEGEVLVKVASASVNPVDWKMRSGAAKDHYPVEFPGILGRDIAGIVREVSPDVRDFIPGDRVMALASHTYAELVAVKAADLARVPEGLDLAESGALPLVVATGDQLIRKALELKSGETVLVTGATGSVGRVAVHAALKVGAKVIAGVRKRHLDDAKRLRATEVLALDDDEAMERMGFVDAVADTVGGKTATALLGKVKQGGRFGTLLGPPAGANLHPTVEIRAMSAVPDPRALEVYGNDIRDGKFVIPIDRMVALEDAGEAQAAAEKGDLGKILLLA